MRNTFLFFTLIGLLGVSNAQVGIGTASPSPAAALHIKPTGQRGLVIPAVPDYRKVIIATAGKDSSYTTGLIVYSKNDGRYYVWNGKGWQCTNPFETDNSDSTIVIAEPFTTISGRFTGSLNGTLTANGVNSFEGNGTIPIGGIIMWSGNPANIGNNKLLNWRLCNGNGTYTDRYGDTVDIPDLRAKFVVGYDNNNSSLNQVGRTGGSSSISISESNLPPHTHHINFLSQRAGQHQHALKTNYPAESGSGIYYNNNSLATNPLPGYYYNAKPTTGDDLFIFDPATDNWSNVEGSLGVKPSPLLEVLSHRHYFQGNTGNGNGETESFTFSPPYYVIAYIIRVQ